MRHELHLHRGRLRRHAPWLHDAADEGKLAGDNAARFPDVQAVRRKVPFSIVFSEPQAVSVGASYDELDKQMTVTGEVSFENQGRSRVMRQNRGLLHVYADAKTGKLRGAQGCGPAMEHLGHLLAWALQLELTLDEDAQAAFLSSGGGRRPAQRAEGCGQKML